MAHRALRLAIIFGIALTSLAAETQAAVTEATVRVRVENHADVPEAILASARDDATRIFRAAGIAIVWLSRDDPCCRDVVRVVLPSLKGADQYLRREHVDSNALGEASAEARLVHIFWDRVRSNASHHGRDEGGLLGEVLAHEIGHVLLPGAGHSSTGIMQASLELRTIATLRFTIEQSETMRNYLRQGTGMAADTEAIRFR